MTSQAVMKRYLTSVAKNNEEYKDNKSMQTLASLIANYKNLDAEDKEVLDAKIESAYNKLQAKGVSASKSTSKATTTRKAKSSSDGGLKGILAELKKKLGAEKFKDATRGTDIKKDIKIPALKKGKRIVRKKGYTSNFYGRFKNKVGSTYYENRANRYDANQPSQTRKYKLADGGEVEKIQVGDYVIVKNNPYWEGGLGSEKSYRRKVKMISGEGKDKDFFFTDGSNSSSKYVHSIKKHAKGGEVFGAEKFWNELSSKEKMEWLKKRRDIPSDYKSSLSRDSFEKLPDWIKSKVKKAFADNKIYKYGQGGKTSDVNYNDILPILKEKLEDGVETLLPNEFEYSSEYKGEEVESKSRDGFIAFTDGGYEVTWFEYVSMFNGGGYKLPTKALDDELQRQVEYNYQYAKDRFKDEYPEIVEELGEDNIDYSSLYDAGYESEAEQLSEWEMDNDDTIMCSVGAYYYSPENPRSKDGKHTIRVFGVVNLESPYHRRGNLEDSIDIDITFDSIEEMEEKLDYEISEICSGWFNGANYNESTEKLRVVRMAKGGKLSSKAKYIPKRDIAEIEVEKNGKSKSIDGANLLDGVYVKKGTKFAKGGKTSEEYAVSGILSENDEIEIISKHKTFASALVKMNKMWDEGKLDKYLEVRVRPISKSLEYAKGGNVSQMTQAEKEQAEKEIHDAWEGKNIDDYVMYSDRYKKGGKMAKGGEVKEKSPKFKVGDKVYSYQNKSESAPIAYARFSAWDKENGAHENDVWKYKLSLKDGYSNWINEESLSKTKMKTFAQGGTTKRIKRKGC